MQFDRPQNLHEVRLSKQDLRSCKGQNLLTFNDSFTYPCGRVNIPISIGEGRNKRTMKICFFAISCGIAYNDLLKMPFLAKLDIGISIVHLMMKYHNNFSKPVVVTTNLHRERRIHEATLNNLLSNYCHL